MRSLKSLSVVPVVTLMVASGLTPPVHAEGEPEHPKYEAPAAFVPFQQLTGTWRGTATHSNGMAHETDVIYRLTSGGSAVAETIFVDTEHEMVTMYFAEGDTLKLTHYCALANQPTMSGEYDAANGVATFTYTDGTNIPDPAAPHMHQVTFKFIDDDHIQTKWILYTDGAPAGDVVIDLERVKPETGAKAAAGAS